MQNPSLIDREPISAANAHLVREVALYGHGAIANMMWIDSQDALLIACGTGLVLHKVDDFTNPIPLSTQSCKLLAQHPSNPILLVAVYGEDHNPIRTEVWNVEALSREERNEAFPAANGAAWSASGRRIALYTVNQRIQLWDWISLSMQFEVGPDYRYGSRLMFTGDEAFLVSVFHEAHIWSLATQETFHIKRPDGQHTLSYCVSPRSSLLAYVTFNRGDALLHVWDLQQQREINAVVDQIKAHTVVFDTTGDLLAVGLEHEISLIHLPSEQITDRWDAEQRGEMRIDGIALSPDGAFVMSFGDFGRDCTLWNRAAHQRIRTWKYDISKSPYDAQPPVVFSKDSRWLVLEHTDSTLELIEAGTGKTAAISDHYFDLITQETFSADSKHLVTGSFDGSIHLWNLETGMHRRMFPSHIGGGHGGVTSIAISPNGKLIAAGATGGMIGVWDVESGLQTLMIRGQGVKNYVRNLVFSPDSRFLGASEPYLNFRLYELEPFREMKPGEDWERTQSLDISPDGKVVAAMRWVGEYPNVTALVRLWSLPDFMPIMETPVPANLDYLKFAPNSQTLLLTGYSDMWIWNWPHDDPQPLYTGDGDFFREFTFSYDSAFMAHTFQWGTIWVWDVAKRERIASLKEEQVTPARNITPGNASRLTFAPHAPLLAHSGKGPSLALWDANTRQDLGVIDATFNPMGRRITFSPDGRFISQSVQSVRLWGVDQRDG